jgi:hypothetical protein
MARFPEMFIGPVVQIKILMFFVTKYIPQIYRAIILNAPHLLVTLHTMLTYQFIDTFCLMEV